MRGWSEHACRSNATLRSGHLPAGLSTSAAAHLRAATHQVVVFTHFVAFDTFVDAALHFGRDLVCHPFVSFRKQFSRLACRRGTTAGIPLTLGVPVALSVPAHVLLAAGTSEKEERCLVEVRACISWS